MDAAAGLTQDSCTLLGVKSIGVDYGLVRTGVALTVGYNPQPLAILQDLNDTQVCEHIVAETRLQQASRVIVGLPLHKNGTIAEQTNLTLTFAKELATHVLSRLGPSVSVELFDERYTSKEAAARLRSANPGQYLYGTLDAEAACIILEHYYNENGVGSKPVELTADERAVCLGNFKNQAINREMQTQARIDERELRILRRKEAIARDQQAIGSESPRKKKKKRKKK